MKARMIVGMLVLALLTAVTAGLGQAQGPGLENRLQPGRTADPADAADTAQQWVGTTIPYAGRLSLASPRDGSQDDGTGQPAAEGTYDFTFALYAVETGGEPLWSELQEGVMVKGGSFSVSLGSVTPIPPTALNGQTLWLAVGVRGPGEAGFTALSPRQQVSAAAPAAPASPAANAACPHDHFGEWWTGSAAGPGLWIANSGAGDGLQVSTEGNNGVLVDSAGVGVHVHEAGNDGVYVSTAGDDGVYVSQAGNPSATEPSSYPNGFEVAGAGGSGLWVGHADLDGVTVQSAAWYGLYVVQADYDGVRVDSAGRSGVVAVSNSALDYGGQFVNTAAGGAGLLATGGDNAAPDLVLGVHGAGDDGRIYSWPEMTGSDILLFSNDEAHVHLDEDNNSTSAFVIYNGANTAVWTVGEKGAATFAAEAGAYGPRTVYAVQATGDWIEDFGTAQLVDGQATVTIEPVFAQMVSLGEYQVFLTPLGDCPLYIAGKTPASFTVRATGGQSCSIAFDYRLVAKRLGNEAARLEPAAVAGEEEDD
jgi:hypothetical protein